LQITSKLIEQQTTPHFMYLYGIFTCTKNDHFLLEKMTGILSDVPWDTLSDVTIKSIITQCIISIYTFHIHTGCLHNDIKTNNIFYIKTENRSEKSYLQYTMDKKTYYLPNNNYVIVLGDFGQSEQRSQNFTFYSFMEYWNEYEYIIENIFNNTENVSENVLEYVEKLINILKTFRKNCIAENYKSIINAINEMFKQLIVDIETQNIPENIPENIIYNKTPYPLDLPKLTIFPKLTI